MNRLHLIISGDVQGVGFRAWVLRQARGLNLTGWVKNRNFTWADYANDAWDEAINCSEYRKPIEGKVKVTLAERGFKCPMEPEKCAGILALDHARYFASPKCAVVALQSIAANSSR